jgi:hypothetical protein
MCALFEVSIKKKNRKKCRMATKGSLIANSRVAIENGCVTGTDLTWVVHDDNLGVERSSLLGGVVLGVGSNVSSSDILDGDVLDVDYATSA